MIKKVEKAKLKIEYEEIYRLKFRKEFSKSYRDFNAFYRGFAPTYYELFKELFYQCDPISLLQFKGLMGEFDKCHKETIYLDYISANELIYLIKGLEILRSVPIETKQEPTKILNFPKVKILSLRKHFTKTFGLAPEVYPASQKINEVRKMENKRQRQIKKQNASLENGYTIHKSKSKKSNEIKNLDKAK